VFLLSTSKIAFFVGSLPIYWYGILYAISVFIAWKFACYLVVKVNNTANKQEFEKFMLFCVIATVIGARLGHVLFFEPGYYFLHPFEIIKLRNGGLSFHGGIIGLAVVVYRFCTKNNYKFAVIADIFAFAGSIGIFLGRIANFINQELYGIITSVNWAVIFTTVDQMPRHPTQLYESIFEGFFSFCVMAILLKLKGNKTIGTGIYAFIFLVLYSASRYIIEFYKEVELFSFCKIFFTIGQVLSLVLFVFAFLIFMFLNKKNNAIKNLNE
jgi:phosphatidylglycerol:prolipoprotein diacylglycerol transferase